MTPPALAYFRYGLKLRGPEGGNARSARRVLEGFLIRVAGGYGSVMPWPELGDAPLQDQWQAFRSGGSTPLLERARACAAADAAARRDGRSLLHQAPVPLSHATATGTADFGALRAEGFTAAKLKGGPDWRAALGQMRQAVAAGLRVRVDFNGLLQEETFLAFARAAEDIKEWVDFVEDPLPYEPARWEWLRQQTGWRLALDRLAGPERGGFDVRVLKPALESAGRRPGPVVFTSYLDHPLGQAFAAWEAARYGDGQELGGLLTHRLFLPDAFSERLARRGPAWRGPGGTGLGFDDLLEALPWVPLAGTSPAAAGRLWQNPRAPLPEGGPPLAPGQIGFATSGSTGKPSVVVHTDASLDASADSVNAWLQARAEDVWLRALPEFHVGGFQIERRAARVGSRVAAEEGKWDPARLLHRARAEGATLLSLVPTQLADLLQLGAAAPESLRAVGVGGGALDEAAAAAARRLGWPILGSYGSSEAASQVATAALASSQGPAPLELLPPWEARVQPDSADPPLPDGLGLLELRGPALATGRYLWTGGTWLFQPLADPDGWWRSSDQVTLAGRTLRFAHRADRAVKVRGELVNLDALEQQLAALGLAAGRFALVARPHPRLGAELVLLAEPAAGPAAPALARLAAVAPPFASVHRAQEVPALPRSPLGKIQYSALAALLRDSIP